MSGLKTHLESLYIELYIHDRIISCRTVCIDELLDIFPGIIAHSLVCVDELNTHARIIAHRIVYMGQ